MMVSHLNIHNKVGFIFDSLSSTLKLHIVTGINVLQLSRTLYLSVHLWCQCLTTTLSHANHHIVFKWWKVNGRVSYL